MNKKKKVHKKKSLGIRILRTVLIILAIVIVLAGGYLGYAFLNFNREGDKDLEVGHSLATAANGKLPMGETLKIMTSNIGFGAYSADFDFFMDGGHESWAFSRKAVYENIDGIMNKIMGKNPDFIVFQEIDRDSTRSYHIDQLEYINSKLDSFCYSFAYNLYKSPYYIIPVYQPHGVITAGLCTYSRYNIEKSNRVELPIMNSIVKFFDLDRCYTVSKIPTENGKYLCIYNVHLSAYGSDDSVREGQLSMLFNDMSSEYEAGNYIVCGGDFNHDLSRDEGEEPYSNWAYPFPRTKFPEHLMFAMDTKWDKKELLPSGRDDDAPYTEGITKTFILDGFIVSDNIDVVDYSNMYSGFLYSDHEPVYMEFKLN